MLIGHSSVREVADALLEVYPHLQAQGYEVVPVSELVPFDGSAIRLSRSQDTTGMGGTELATP